MRTVRMISRFWLQQVKVHGGHFNIVVQTNIAG